MEEIPKNLIEEEFISDKGFFSLSNVNKRIDTDSDANEDDDFDDISKISVFDIESNGRDILIGMYSLGGYEFYDNPFQWLKHARQIAYFYADYDVPVMLLKWGKYLGGAKMLGMEEKWFVMGKYMIQKRKNSYLVLPSNQRLINLYPFYNTSLYDAYSKHREIICKKLSMFKDLCFSEEEMKEWKEDKAKRKEFKDVDVYSGEIIKYNEMDVRATFSLVLLLHELYKFKKIHGLTVSGLAGAMIIGANPNYQPFEIPRNYTVEYMLMNLYKGGLFDTVVQGHFSRVYKYDVNSMYPFFSSMLPKVEKVEFVEYPKSVSLEDMINRDVYFDGKNFHKVKEIHVYYGDFYQPIPSVVTKAKQFAVLVKHFKTAFFDFEAFRKIKGRVYAELILHIDPNNHPFENVRKLYEERLQLKKVKDPREKSVKLIMNSFYGKFVERIGSGASYQNLIYGAMITAMGRTYIQQFPAYSYLTDSIITPYRLSSSIVGEELGQFKLEGEGEVYLLGNGMYVLEDPEEKMIKLRGYHPKKYASFTEDDIKEFIVKFMVKELEQGRRTKVIVDEDIMVKSEQVLRNLVSQYGEDKFTELVENLGLLYTMEKIVSPIIPKRHFRRIGNRWIGYVMNSADSVLEEHKRTQHVLQQLDSVYYREIPALLK